MIKSFRDKGSEDVWNGENSPAARKIPQQLWNVASRKLDMLNAAVNIEALMAAPGNRLEKLKGDLKDFYSIRINEQYRIVFRWDSGVADDVEITDYH